MDPRLRAALVADHVRHGWGPRVLAVVALAGGLAAGVLVFLTLTRDARDDEARTPARVARSATIAPVPALAKLQADANLPPVKTHRARHRDAGKGVARRRRPRRTARQERTVAPPAPARTPVRDVRRSAAPTATIAPVVTVAPTVAATPVPAPPAPAVTRPSSGPRPEPATGGTRAPDPPSGGAVAPD